jgi:hypothetical protein
MAMAYLDDVAGVATTWREEIEADLARINDLLGRSRQQVAELESRAVVLNWLLALSRGGTSEAPAPTLHAAMATVLAGAPERMMRPAHLVAEINSRGLYRMRDGRPVEAQQIHARVGQNKHLFAREGTFIKLIG